MSQPVVMGAKLMCSFGTSPGNLIVPPAKRVLLENKPVANVMDFAPMANITPFGQCLSMANPMVAAATAAASGVLTPQPCIPVTTGPWKPGAAAVLVANQPMLNNVSICNCAWGGVITVSNAGSTKETCPP